MKYFVKYLVFSTTFCVKARNYGSPLGYGSKKCSPDNKVQYNSTVNTVCTKLLLIRQCTLKKY